ncbi:MAG: type II/IV secretion system protein [Bacilli bacterium]|nr:type II/IV secretion system protein [Bacilli bacterium]
MKEFDFEKVPIVEIANEIISDAVKRNASDIHFDPTKNSVRIRIRIDGILTDYSIVPEKYKRNMISRIKMIAGMNIMETRLPQDGAIKSRLGKRALDLRVSSLPTNMGEKVVIRILDYSKSLQGLDTLGLSDEAIKKIDRMIKVPNGIILVTGATGAGKSTTVYSILQKMNTDDVNIITVEDPVEMDIAGINQVQAQAEIGLTFANVLRSILRQDPDIIMIGEIRDDETARIAVRASITGHKVLSTIHTNNSLNTIERLTDMDVERYLLGASLEGIISQKLARRLCPECKKLRPISNYEKEIFKRVLNKDVNEIYDANPDGCEHCFRGYAGRIGLYEVLNINDDIRDAITNALPKSELRKLVYKSGVITLLQDGLEKALAGETSFSEILKAVDLENDLENYSEDNLRSSLDDVQRIKQAEERANEEFTIISNQEEPKKEEIQTNNESPVEKQAPKSPPEIEYFNF